MTLGALVRAFTGNRAQTDPGAVDEALRGRTYAVPFDRVWTGAVRLADGGLRGWTLVEADDQEGRIRAESRTLVFRFVDDVEVEIGLDENAQTRVDMSSRSRKGTVDFGVNRRRVRRFFRALDREIDVRPEQVLSPTLPSPKARSSARS